jgi:hypothetical protein
VYITIIPVATLIAIEERSNEIVNSNILLIVKEALLFTSEFYLEQ